MLSMTTSSSAPPTPPTPTPSTASRSSTAAGSLLLRSSSPIEGDRLIAAVSTRDGVAIADPFTRSADAVELLRRRARQLDAARPRRRRRGRRVHALPRPHPLMPQASANAQAR